MRGAAIGRAAASAALVFATAAAIGSPSMADARNTRGRKRRFMVTRAPCQPTYSLSGLAGFAGTGFSFGTSSSVRFRY
jgi:hypothetical protein